MNICDYYPDLETFLVELKGVKVDYNEWNWKRFNVGGKPFCAFCNDGSAKPYIVVKGEKEFNDLMRSAYKGLIRPAPDMNKVYWSAITPDKDIPQEIVKKMCSRGYKVVFEKLPQNLRNKILEE
ncbi:MAG: hypothetical protein E7509_00885 [Ruminococcus sp.]|nr:hypothetical protein [Ruminococcus sp.]